MNPYRDDPVLVAGQPFHVANDCAFQVTNLRLVYEFFKTQKKEVSRFGLDKLILKPGQAAY